MKTVTIKTLVAIAAGTLVGGLILGWIIFSRARTIPSSDVEATHEAGVTTVWTCSMHPQIRSNEPGKCPICGMDLVKVGSDYDNDGGNTVTMSRNSYELASIETTVVGRERPSKEIRMSGKVQADERKVYSQASHIPGRIEQLNINFTGEVVTRGQTLAVLYSPDLVTAQQELFEAYKVRESQPSLYAASREKLRNWKLSDRYIDNLIENGKPIDKFPIAADVSGIVLRKNVNLGDYVDRGKSLYEIADLSRVWILLDLYEIDMPWVKVGDGVAIRARSLPGQTFQGKISFIDPVLDPQTRVASARVELANPGAALKPEMFVNGIVESGLEKKTETIVVPKSAVMWTGERSVVYVRRPTEYGAGFEMKVVTLGPEVGDGYVIKDGLAEGDEIVTHGTFAVDAAAQLAGKPSMMNQETASAVQDYPKVTKLVSLYITLKDALVSDNFDLAKSRVNEIESLLATVNMRQFTAKDHEEWMKNGPGIKELIHKMTAAKTIGDLRQDFKALSEAIIQVARYFGGPAGATLYVEHCPMADGNLGADWLSMDREIKNPYFGSAMLTCGEVTDEIK
jgi:membrane fusion protein, copper/silver efflux system